MRRVPQHLSEIVGDIASAAIRGARINIDMEEFRDGVFPVFRRRRHDEDEGIDEDDSDGKNTSKLGIEVWLNIVPRFPSVGSRYLSYNSEVARAESLELTDLLVARSDSKYKKMLTQTEGNRGSFILTQQS